MRQSQVVVAPEEIFSEYFPTTGIMVNVLIKKGVKIEVTDELLKRKHFQDKFYETVLIALTEQKDEKIWIKLVESLDITIQAALILNPKISDVVVDRIIDIGIPSVMSIIINNRKLNQQQIEKLQKNKHFAVRAMAKDLN